MMPRLTIAAITLGLGLGLTACGGGGATAPSASSAAATATSAAGLGGMDALVQAAKAEGTINVVALPDDWANYGQMKKDFETKYGIKVNSILPDASSKEEIDAADKNKGTANAPDVFDLGSSVTLASTDHFAPYQVTGWEQIPAANKEASGLWVNDYAGVMAVGYNATKFGDITSLDQLTDPKFRGQVAFNGKPTEAAAASNGYFMVNNASGGTLDNLQPGLDVVKKWKQAGSLNLADVTAGTIDAGTHGVVFDWSYNQVSTQARLKDKGVDWKVFVPKGGEIASFYNQAVNKDAPHPAAARLWQEYVYSDAGQNTWLKGGARPVRFDAMKTAGTVDAAAEASLPKLEATPQSATAAQVEAATAFFKQNWDAAVS